VLFEIDGLPLHDKSAADVRRLMLGAAGSPITLTVAPHSAPTTRAKVRPARKFMDLYQKPGM